MKQSQSSSNFRPFAAIDIGSTALRMNIAQVDENGMISPLESLQRSLTLGKDTFTRGYIRRQSIEECVQCLQSFRRILEEYQITSEDQIRVMATTAVREASNRDTFIDRIYIATTMSVEILDEVDITRLTYLSARACLSEFPEITTPNILISEMSGGTTELLLLQKHDVVLSKTYRLGSLRLREMLGAFRAPLGRQRELMETDIHRTIEQVKHSIDPLPKMALFGIGGDTRYAAAHLLPHWDHTTPIKLPVKRLAQFTEEMLTLTVDEIVHRYHMSFSDAETLGPSLLFYVQLARALNISSIVVTNISMRHGALVEMAIHGIWSDEFKEQIIHSSVEIGRKFSFDENHAKHVAHLSSLLFHQLRDEHRLDPWYELLLRIAALLHDVGSFISIRSHHKHSMYLIRNSEIFGLNRKNILLIALIARYHRRSSPKPSHEGYATLDRESRLVVAKLAALLRIADALDRSDCQHIKEISCSRKNDRMMISVAHVEDLTLEQMALQNKRSMFEDVYGMEVVLRKQGKRL